MHAEDIGVAGAEQPARRCVRFISAAECDQVTHDTKTVTFDYFAKSAQRHSEFRTE
jgi:hypothetical protein